MKPVQTPGNLAKTHDSNAAPDLLPEVDILDPDYQATLIDETGPWTPNAVRVPKESPPVPAPPAKAAPKPAAKKAPTKKAPTKKASTKK